MAEAAQGYQVLGSRQDMMEGRGGSPQQVDSSPGGERVAFCMAEWGMGNTTRTLKWPLRYKESRATMGDLHVFK